MVRLRQTIDQLRHRLGFIPTASIFSAIVIAQLMLWIDGELDDQGIPRFLQTTVGSGRAILAAIAGGLISSVTLLLSLMLVAVQLASSQFSPRTLRNWIGDRTQQWAIGIVLGTTVYCLLILRETRVFDEGGREGAELTPHLSVILAVVLGIGSLLAVVRSVDHLTNRLRIGSVAAMLLDETVALIETTDRRSVDNPELNPASVPTKGERRIARPADAHPVLAESAGWVQQIDTEAILRALPEHSTIDVTIAAGSFSYPGTPIAWMWPAPDDDACFDEIRRSFAFGDTRTMQQDIGFGIMQMVDIALRALSPGVNDPNTANDLIVHLGAVLLALWEREVSQPTVEHDTRTLIRSSLDHEDYLQAAFGSIRVHGAGDPDVAATMVRTLEMLRTETIRRSLPGPVAPLETAIRRVLDSVDAADLFDYDKTRVHALVPDLSPRLP